MICFAWLGDGGVRDDYSLKWFPGFPNVGDQITKRYSLRPSGNSSFDSKIPKLSHRHAVGVILTYNLRYRHRARSS
jgi:hypothetical protein